ncbi:MAG: hypothetical protein OEY86_07605 [Nitrospira sp.]|nr:hypothetical protein [Nitrospira sp.]
MFDEIEERLSQLTKECNEYKQLNKLHKDQFLAANLKNAQLKAELGVEVTRKKEFERDWLEACDLALQAEKELAQLKAEALAWRQQVEAKNLALDCVHGAWRQARVSALEECKDFAGSWIERPFELNAVIKWLEQRITEAKEGT